MPRFRDPRTDLSGWRLQPGIDEAGPRWRGARADAARVFLRGTRSARLQCDHWCGRTVRLPFSFVHGYSVSLHLYGEMFAHTRNPLGGAAGLTSFFVPESRGRQTSPRTRLDQRRRLRRRFDAVRVSCFYRAFDKEGALRVHRLTSFKALSRETFARRLGPSRGWPIDRQRARASSPEWRRCGACLECAAPMAKAF